MADHRRFALGPLDATGRAYRRTMAAIAAAIFVFAAGQALWALAVDSRQLLKDGLDWGYDVVLYALAALVFGRGRAAEQVSALAIAAILAVAGLHTLWDLSDKIANPRPIELGLLGFSAASAIAVGAAVVAALWRFRGARNPLILATWVSARNDAIATVGFALAILAARAAPMRWPEYALDVLGAALNAQAAAVIVRAVARERGSHARSQPSPAGGGSDRRSGVG